MRGKTIAIAAAVAALLLLPAGAGARLPSEFVGISPQMAANHEDFSLMEEAGIENMRLPLFWMGVEQRPPFAAEPSWADFDRSVELAAEYGMRVFPFVWGSPPWISNKFEIEPMRNTWQRRAWASFLHRAVRRYGANGTFWRDHPELPYKPVRAWEVWNEQNIVSFAANSNPERYARLLRISGSVIHRADPGAKVIIGGLFGRPLQVPPNVASGDFLARVYRAEDDIKQHFDGVGLHPYVAAASAMRGQILNLRRVMDDYDDAQTPLYITEMGWGSDGFESRWERGPYGQARELNRAFRLLAGNRHRWRIAGVWWFSWTDIEEGCQFCDSAGLLNRKREAKPAWYRFVRWTGGDPHIVPQARLGPRVDRPARPLDE